MTPAGPLLPQGVVAFAERTHVRRTLLVLLALIVLGLGANSVRRAMKGASSAFDDTMLFAEELVLDGVNVYRTHPGAASHTKYPPFFFVVVSPFAALPTGWAASLWYLLNLGLAVGAVVLAVRAAWPADATRAPPWTAYASAVLLCAWVIGANLSRGQVNIVIVFLAVAAVHGASRGHDRRAGAILAIAFMMKLTPALLLAYFLWRRRWGVLWGFGAGVVVCFAVQQGALGMERGLDAGRAWLEVLVPFAKQGVLAEGDPVGIRSTNQSLAAALFRFLTERPADGAGGTLYVNVLALPDAVVNLATRILSAGLLVAVAIGTRGGRIGADQRLRLACEASLVLVLMVVISPIAWSNHYVALILPAAAALEGVRRMAPGDPRRPRLRALLWAALALSLAPAHVLPLALSLQLAGAGVLAAVVVAGTPRRIPTA